MNDMAMPAEQHRELMTADELEKLAIPGKSKELVRGRLIVREPPGIYHGKIAAKLTYILGAFVQHDLAGLHRGCKG